MIIYLLRKFFKIAIGSLPSEKRTVFWNKFTTLLEEVVKAAAAGAASGAIKK